MRKNILIILSMALLFIYTTISRASTTSHAANSSSPQELLIDKLNNLPYQFRYATASDINDLPFIQQADDMKLIDKDGIVTQHHNESVGVILTYSKTLREVLEESKVIKTINGRELSIIEVECNIGMQIAVLIDNGLLDYPFQLSLFLGASFTTTDLKIFYIEPDDPKISSFFQNFPIDIASKGEWVIEDRDGKLVGLFGNGFESHTFEEITDLLDNSIIKVFAQIQLNEDFAAQIFSNLFWKLNPENN